MQRLTQFDPIDLQKNLEKAMKNFLFALIAALFSVSSMAQSDDSKCPEGLAEVMSSYLKLESLASHVLDQTCKPWPHDGNTLLVVLAYDKGIEYQKSLVVATL